MRVCLLVCQLVDVFWLGCLVLAKLVRVCLVDVCWPYGCVLNMAMFVGLVDVCCPC